MWEFVQFTLFEQQRSEQKELVIRIITTTPIVPWIANDYENIINYCYNRRIMVTFQTILSQVTIASHVFEVMNQKL